MSDAVSLLRSFDNWPMRIRCDVSATDVDRRSEQLPDDSPPAPSPQPPAPSPARRLAGDRVRPGLGRPAPGTIGAAAIWGLPLAWAIGRIAGCRLADCGDCWSLNLVGIPLATAAGRALGGEKDNQAIVWDEIVTVPIVFLLVPLANWRVALAGFCAASACSISRSRRRRASWSGCRKVWA